MGQILLWHLWGNAAFAYKVVSYKVWSYKVSPIRYTQALLVFIHLGLSYQFWVNIGSSNGLVPSDTKPLLEQMLTSTNVDY